MNPSSKHPAEQGDDTEWEYEYHETETECFYVTLDLSSAFSAGRPRKKPKTSTIPSGSLQPTTSAGSQGITSQDTQTPPQPEVTPQGTPEPQEVPSDGIQILDFHTPNPIISYQNQLYTCTWTSTVGTDLLLTAPDPTATFPKLKEGKGFDVLAATNIKLVGKPAQLVPRHDARISRDASLPPEPQAAEADPPPQTTNGETAEQRRNGLTKIDVGSNPSQSRQSQALFLERLMAVKAKRGETDSVPVHSKKVFTGTGWRSQQRDKRARAEQQQEGAENAGEGASGLALEEQDSDDDFEEVDPARSRGGRARFRTARSRRSRGIGGWGRVRGGWRSSGIATGGTSRAPAELFGNSRSGSADVEGMDSPGGGAATSMGTTTPRTWDDLVQADRSDAGTTAVARAAGDEIAGANGGGTPEARPVDATITSSAADSNSGLGVGADGAPEEGNTPAGQVGTAEVVVRDAPDVDISMEDAP